MKKFNLPLIAISLFLMGNGFDLFATIPGIRGNGNSASNPYIINDENIQAGLETPLSKLNKIAKWVNKDTSGTDGWNGFWTSTGKYFKLEADIFGFTGTIGTNFSAFMGTFDGNGHRIDVNINKFGGGYLGLFGYAQNAVIKNLTVTGSVVGAGYVGGILGCGSNVWIEHCTNLANVTAKDPYALPPLQPDPPSYTTYIAGAVFSGVYAGGIAGGCLIGGIKIVQCANAGRITGVNSIGGIIGYGGNSAEVFRCINIGTVRGSSSVGGIAGGYANTIDNSLNGGFVVGSSSVGGIAGNCGTLTTCTILRYCLNTGVVHGDWQHVGSIAGYMPTTTNSINNLYDKQMSSKGGINGSDIAGAAVGKVTSELTGDNLSAWNALWTMHTYSSTPLYPTPSSVGNLYYSSNYDYANSHLEHVAAATLELHAHNPSFWVTADDIWNDNFHTRTWAAVCWTAQLGNAKISGTINTTFSYLDSAKWDNSGAAHVGDTMVANCYAYAKQVPISVRFGSSKITSAANYANTFSASEVTPNIVTDNATMDIQTSTEGNLNVSIYDLAGTKVANVTDKYVSANTALQVDLNGLFGLSAGSYMAVVSVGNEVIMRKFVKQ